MGAVQGSQASSQVSFLRQKGHEVVRTPPCYPEYQPIEKVWSLIKQHVAENNTFKLSDTERLIREGIDMVTPDHCAGFMRVCQRLCREEAERLGALEEMPQVIPLSSDSEEERSSEESSEE